MIDEDLGLLYTQSKEGIALGGKVLVVRRDPGISFAVWPCLAGAFVCLLYGFYFLLRLVSHVRFVP